MRILALMPTFGRRQSLLNNAIACFQAQTHADKLLLIYDDLGTLMDTNYDVDGMHILCNKNRSASVGQKYNEMLSYTEQRGIRYDAVAVWDDDDVYLPQSLEHHAATLEMHRWSKPSTIWSAYFDPPKIEGAAGRFHGSIAIHSELIDAVGGWIDTTRATFDQEFLSLLNAHTPPGDTCERCMSQYVYRWGSSQSGHCSGLMGSPDWYARYQPDSREPIDRLWPEFDADTVRIMNLIQNENGLPA